jgi:predicted HicB family RNase H-like nuclease
MGNERTSIGLIRMIRRIRERSNLPYDFCAKPARLISQEGKVMLSYKGFLGGTDYDDEAEVFYGTLLNANVIMSFRGASVKELKSSFRNVVDTYLEDCERDGIEPEKPFSGKITVRVSPVLHRRIAIKAAAKKESMNQYLEELIEQDTKDVEAAIG